MKVKCKNCAPEDGIEVPAFTQLEKNKLLALTIKSSIHSTKYIIDNFNLSHSDAKYIVTHISKTYGQCNRCNFDKLTEEYINCPKCGTLNFNWRQNENSI